jgi:hypothetical protein
MWRRAEAERLTRERRGDLWDRYLAAPGGAVGRQDQPDREVER